VFGKPEAVFGINVRAGEVLTFAGNFDPCMLPCLPAYILAGRSHTGKGVKTKPVTG